MARFSGLVTTSSAARTAAPAGPSFASPWPNVQKLASIESEARESLLHSMVFFFKNSLQAIDLDLDALCEAFWLASLESLRNTDFGQGVVGLLDQGTVDVVASLCMSHEGHPVRVGGDLLHCLIQLGVEGFLGTVAIQSHELHSELLPHTGNGIASQASTGGDKRTVCPEDLFHSIGAGSSLANLILPRELGVAEPGAQDVLTASRQQPRG